MTRTTPPRPVDVAAIFPALAPLARTATRLHPRPGTPSPHDSSVGGPLLWPASEPWPHCHGPHTPDGLGPLILVSLADAMPLAEPRPMPVAMSLADARLKRRIKAANQGRKLTTQEREALRRIVEGIPMPDGPIAMLPVAQLYVRDVPGLRPPAGADLVQVLWCPFDHDSDSGGRRHAQDCAVLAVRGRGHRHSPGPPGAGGG
jgi:hypothetical protein